MAGLPDAIFYFGLTLEVKGRTVNPFFAQIFNPLL